LLARATGDSHGEFFDLEEALILPAPEPAIPIVSEVVPTSPLRRAGRLATGLIGIWNSARRFEEADRHRRRPPPQQPAGARSNGNTRCKSGAA